MDQDKQYLDPTKMSDHELLQIFQSARDKGAYFTIDFSDTRSRTDFSLKSSKAKDANSFETKNAHSSKEEQLHVVDKTDPSNESFSECDDDNKDTDVLSLSIVSSGKKKRSETSNRLINKKNYKCIVCDKCLPTRMSYGLHHHEEHSGNKQSNSGKKFSCSQCSKHFASATTYLDHVLSHGSPADHQYSCPNCSVKVASRKELYRHKLVHREKRFLCPLCDQTFDYQSDKKRHMKFHSDTKAFKCGTCGVAFTTKYQLQRHSKIHVPRLMQMFQCGICKLKVTSKILLVNHYKTEHEDSKKFICDHCGKAYMTKLSLQRHLSSHEAKQFGCMHCEKVFHRKAVLEVHIRSHTGEKPFKCNTCGKDFSQNSSLRRHKSRQKDCGFLSM